MIKQILIKPLAVLPWSCSYPGRREGALARRVKTLPLNPLLEKIREYSWMTEMLIRKLGENRNISDRALILLPFYCLFRQMTMETVESQQDGGVTNSVAESKSAHMQTQTGQNSVPTLAQVNSV